MARSALDRFAIVAVVIAGVVEAEQAALSKAPNVALAYPVLNLSGVWNFVPLAFIGIAGTLWLAERVIALRNRLQRKGFPQYEPPGSQSALVPVSQPTDRVVEPKRIQIDWPAVWSWVWGAFLLVFVGLLGSWIVSSIAATRHAQQVAIEASPMMKEPPVIRGAFTMAFVKQTIQTQDPVSAESILSKYLGTTMRVSGIVHESTGQRGYQIYIFTLTGKNTVPQVYMIIDHADLGMSEYQEGDHIAAECKVERLDATGLGLDGCVPIRGEAWTSTVAKR